jgi:peptidoglycan LD-endopeptidase LytH
MYDHTDVTPAGQLGRRDAARAERRDEPCSLWLPACRRTAGVLTPCLAATIAVVGVLSFDMHHAGRAIEAEPRVMVGGAHAGPAAAMGGNGADALEFTETGIYALAAEAAGGAVIPVSGITADALQNTFGQPRPDERRHIGIDIAAPRGTPVVAALDGWIVSLPQGGAGGRGLHLRDRTGRYLLYYAHLDAYADGVWPGMAVRRRELLGYVGTSGNAEVPHLHFEVGRIVRPGTLQVEPINPYTFLTRPRPVATSH